MKNYIASLLLLTIFAGPQVSPNDQPYIYEQLDANDIVIPLNDEENAPAN